jgi:hypothetical protein
MQPDCQWLLMIAFDHFAPFVTNRLGIDKSRRV